MSAPILSLTTDYGLADGFVAACHGAALQRVPQLRIIDISHQIPPGDVRRGAAILAQTVPYLPFGVHVAVVDPGVGTTRHPLAIDTGAGILVGPDNGLLTWAALALGGAKRAMALTNSQLHRHPTSHTFHGRDIFVPVAACLADTTKWDELGDAIAVKDLVRLAEPMVRVDDAGLSCDVLNIDHFGNVQLAATGKDLDGFAETFAIAGNAAVRGDMFASANTDALVVLIDSADHVAIAVNGGSAAERLEIHAGMTVRLDANIS